jgi:hypothetical protein
VRILHILKSEPEESVKNIIEEHKKDNDVRIIDLKNNEDYSLIMNFIEWSDKVFSW